MGVGATDDGIVIGVGLDITHIKKAVSQMTGMFNDFGAGSAKAISQVDKSLADAKKNASKFKIEPNTEGIKDAVDRLDRLNAVIVNQQAELNNCQRDYDRVSERMGSTSDEALKLQRRMLQLEDSIDKNTKKSNDFADAINDAERVMGAAGDAAEKMGGAAKEAGQNFEAGGKGAGTMDIALGTLIGNGISKAISACAALLDQTKELRRDLSFLSENAGQAGISMDLLNDKAGELYAVTGDTNEVVEALSNVLATGMSADRASEAIDLLAGAVVKFPETMKIESLADSMQETIATGEATGQYAELLGRLGINVDKFNDKMGRTTNASKRQQIAIQALQREGLDDLWNSYKANNETMIDAAKANYDLQRTYADLAVAIEPIETKIKTTFMQILVDHEDQILAIVDAAGRIISVGADVLSFLSELNPAVLIIGGALALVVVKAAGVAIGTQLMAHGVSAATRTLSTAGPQAAAVGAQFLMLAVDILIVAAAVALAAAGIAMLIYAIKGVPMSINTPKVDNVGDIRSQVTQGYADGTMSATPGWRWVGEEGPELMRFSGGEQVYTATQSRMLAASRSGGGETYYDQRQYVFKVEDIEEYLRIKNMLENRKTSIRQGKI